MNFQLTNGLQRRQVYKHTENVCISTNGKVFIAKSFVFHMYLYININLNT